MGTPKDRCAGCHDPLPTDPKRRRFHRISQQESIPYCIDCYHAPYEETCRNCKTILHLKHRCPQCQAPRLRKKIKLPRQRRRKKKAKAIRPALFRQ